MTTSSASPSSLDPLAGVTALCDVCLTAFQRAIEVAPASAPFTRARVALGNDRFIAIANDSMRRHVCAVLVDRGTETVRELQLFGRLAAVTVVHEILANMLEDVIRESGIPRTP